MFTASQKKLFLIDAFGAVVSAFFLGIVLVRLQERIGMPLHMLYILAIIPCFFAVYSFSCYFFLKRNWRPFLKAIAVANLMYCFLTLTLLIIHFDSMTNLGLLYFVVELIIVGVLVTIQLKATSKAS